MEDLSSMDFAEIEIETDVIVKISELGRDFLDFILLYFYTGLQSDWKIQFMQVIYLPTLHVMYFK